MGNINKATRLNANRKVVSGIKKHLSGSVTLEGVKYTPTRLAQMFQGGIDIADATDQAAKAWHLAVATEKGNTQEPFTPSDFAAAMMAWARRSMTTGAGLRILAQDAERTTSQFLRRSSLATDARSREDRLNGGEARRPSRSAGGSFCGLRGPEHGGATG
jgi:hypothetical protein